MFIIQILPIYYSIILPIFIIIIIILIFFYQYLDFFILFYNLLGVNPKQKKGLFFTQMFVFSVILGFFLFVIIYRFSSD